jgi:hypothetical protein
LLGGEVLVERLALQATRMRSIGDDAPQIARQNQVKRISAGQRDPVVVPAEPQTELIDRVVEQRQPPRRPPTQPQRPQRPAAHKPQQPPREPERQVRPPLPREQRLDPSDPGSGWWEPVIPPGQPTPRQEAYHRPVAGDPAASLGEGLEMSWTPSWERGQQPGRPPRPPKAPQTSQPLPKPAAPAQQARPTDAIARPKPQVEAATRVQQPVVEPPSPPPAVESVGRRRAEDTGGRRRAPEPEAGRHSEPGESTGGRRRRPDDAPSWQDSLGARTTGSHAKPAPPPEPSGSHTEGRSVSELLAAHGNAESPRRRRRRED